MGKRPIVDAVRDGSQAPRHSKRPRIHTSHEQHSPGPSAVAEQVTTAQDLQEALLFDQSSTSHLRSGKSLLCFRARAVQGLPLQVLACSSDSSTPSSTQQKKTSYLVSGLFYATISIRRQHDTRVKRKANSYTTSPRLGTLQPKPTANLSFPRSPPL